MLQTGMDFNAKYFPDMPKGEFKKASTEILWAANKYPNSVKSFLPYAFPNGTFLFGWKKIYSESYSNK